MLSHEDIFELFRVVYDTRGTSDAWLAGLLHAIYARFGKGAGGSALYVDVSNTRSPFGFGFCCIDTDLAYQRESYLRWADVTPPELVSDMWLRLGCGYRSELIRSMPSRSRYSRAEYEASFAATRVVEMFAIMAIMADGRGCFVSLHERTSVRGSAKSPAHVFGKLLQPHIVAAMGIRNRLAVGDDVDRLAALVVDAEGRVRHASAEAARRSLVEPLRAVALAADRARARKCAPDVHETIELWRRITTGGLAVLDQFDAQGRRHLIVVDVSCTDTTQGLSERDIDIVQMAARGRSNKWIAQELSVSEPTVSTVLGAAARKLGFRNRIAMLDAVVRGTVVLPGSKRT